MITNQEVVCPPPTPHGPLWVQCHHLSQQSRQHLVCSKMMKTKAKRVGAVSLNTPMMALVVIVPVLQEVIRAVALSLRWAHSSHTRVPANHLLVLKRLVHTHYLASSRRNHPYRSATRAIPRRRTCPGVIPVPHPSHPFGHHSFRNPGKAPSCLSL